MAWIELIILILPTVLSGVALVVLGLFLAWKEHEWHKQDIRREQLRRERANAQAFEYYAFVDRLRIAIRQEKDISLDWRKDGF
jgi:hypothetical protein